MGVSSVEVKAKREGLNLESYEHVDTTAQAILNAALKLYLEFGLRRTTMDDVARSIGMTRVTIYRYYADKGALFEAVVLREWLHQVQQIYDMSQHIENPEERLIEVFVMSIDGTRKHPLICRLLDSDTEWLLPYLTVKADVIFKYATFFMTDYITQMQDQGFLRHLNANFVAELMVRLSQSIVLTSGGLLAPESLQALREVTSKFLLPLLVGQHTLDKSS